MKMDVQGYECNVVRGAERFFGSNCVDSVTGEAEEAWLRAQHCSTKGLANLLTRNGSDSGLRVLTRKTCGHCKEKTMIARRHDGSTGRFCGAFGVR